MKYLITSLLFLVPSLLAAAPIPVQTGWHDDFTRVVLIVPRGSDWRLGRSENGYTLGLSSEDGFDTSRFFELIPGERITDVDQDASVGELYLGVACDCHISVTQDSPSILVLDVRDGPPPDGSIYEAPFADSNPEDLTTIDVLPAPNAVAAYKVPSNRLLPLAYEISPDLQMAGPVINPSSLEQPTGPSFVEHSSAQDITTETIDDLASLERSITESLGRALSQGLLETDLGDISGNAVSNHHAIQNIGISPGISATTGIDNTAIPDDPFVPTSQDGTECLESRFFAVHNWGDERPFSFQISERRGATINKAGDFDESAITRLAQNYIYFGFGREAIQAIEMDSRMSQERQIISILAKLIDDEPLETDIFAQQVSCDSNVALWAFLLPSEDARDAQINRPAVLRTFKMLPQSLQLHLAPRLADRFIAIGDNDSALEVLGAVKAQNDKSLDVQLAENSLARALGEQEEAVAQIAEIVETDVRVTPEIMIMMFEDAIENNLMISAENLLLADALRFENASLPIAADLAAAQVRAFLQNSQFIEANSLLQEAGDEISAGVIDDLKNLYAFKATSKMQDYAFLEFAFETDHSALLSANRNPMAERALNLGFPDLASEILKEEAEGLEAEKRRYLLAEAAFALGDIDRVLALLGDDESERATSLRQVITDFSTEAGITPLAYTSSTPATDQWRRGEWENLQSADDPLLKAASLAVLQTLEPEIGTETPLANGRTLLDQAEQARTVVNELLQRFAGPD